MLQFLAKFIEKRQRWFGMPLVLVMACSAFALTITHPHFLELVELKVLDNLFVTRGVRQPEANIIIVAVDDKSLSEIGRWPWPRDKITAIYDRVLGEYGARAIGMDIIFSEEQRNPVEESIRLLAKRKETNKEVSQWLGEHSAIGDLDAHLVDSISKYRERLVLGYFFYPEGDKAPAMAMAQVEENSFLLAPSEMNLETVGEANFLLPHMLAVEANIPRVMEVADAAGFFNFFPDADGLVHRVPLIGKFSDMIFPNLDLQTLRVALGRPELSVRISEAGVEEVRLGARSIETGPGGAMLLNYYGPGYTFTHISAVDLLQGKADPAQFKDAIVLLGVTAIGVFDHKPSPFDTIFPGVEAHATGMANILDGSELRRPTWLKFSEWLGVLFLSLACGWFVRKRSPAFQGLAIVGLPVVLHGTAFWMFANFGLWLKETYLILGILMSTLPSVLVEYILESRKRAFIHDAFSHYLAPEVVDKLADNPDALSLGGEERCMTAFFSDIASFSTFSEPLKPEELVHFLNQYLSAMSDIIMENGGTIDKYEGDAIIAFFGAPLDMPDHAWRGAKAAMEQQELLAKLRVRWAEQGHPDVHVRMGLDSGPMVVGNMGTEKFMNYTMMGDHVNLAARLEGVNKVYRTPTLISQDTYAMAKEHLEARFVDRVRVVGRKTPVDIYAPLGEIGQVPEELLDLAQRYREAWDQMAERKFEQAAQALTRLNADFPCDGPTQVLLARIEEFIKTPPPEDWQGVYILSSK
jgi:adenylate cyclase